MTTGTKNQKQTKSDLVQTGRFFVIVGLFVALALFLLDPRATDTSPGAVLIGLGVVLAIIGWIRGALVNRTTFTRNLE
ncbi:hypothetical protein EDL96_10250 [Kocuria soli]|uniref:Uncharacterized protein n=1 Tax=Kocuria soli TaxID=2485125 RepID=A0A3N3ZN95_9MICC|nr:hypothetical protein EDL96_10250 [Kocuria soli]